MSNVPGTTDIVGIFRPSKDVPPVGENMLRKEGFKVIWMTEGIFSKESERMAKDKGVEVI